jgi:hypothetical protein
MALEYTLEIAGQTQISELAKRLCSVPKYRHAAEGAIAPGLQVHIGLPHSVEIEIIEEEFGFTSRQQRALCSGGTRNSSLRR